MRKFDKIVFCSHNMNISVKNAMCVTKSERKKCELSTPHFLFAMRERKGER